MKFMAIDTIRTDIHPDDITGAVLYLVVGSYGDGNLDHAVALEGFGPAWQEKDGVRRMASGQVEFDEEFEMAELPKFNSALAALSTKAGIQLARVKSLEIHELAAG